MRKVNINIIAASSTNERFAIKNYGLEAAMLTIELSEAALKVIEQARPVLQHSTIQDIKINIPVPDFYLSAFARWTSPASVGFLTMTKTGNCFTVYSAGGESKIFLPLGNL